MDSLVGKIKYLLFICVLKRRVAAYIKQLKKVWGIYRYTECNNLIYRIELIEFKCCIAAVAIKDKEAIDSLYIRLYILIKILNPFISKLICSLAIIINSKYPVSR